jgi:dTDP-4-dehydrorhamnose reductase
MRILIYGIGGMLGHKLWQVYRDRYEVFGTVRKSPSDYARYAIFDTELIIGNVDALAFDSVAKAMRDVRPDVVINCIGIIKQLKSAHDPLLSIEINALFPHRLYNLCRASGSRMFHISTDCVFNGRKGMYTETDPSDAEDLYGRTKFLGEVSAPGCVTLRTSIIGRELETTLGLVEWLLTNRGGKVQGYRKAIYSGFTTEALAHIIKNLIDLHPDVSGLYQVSSEPINKYDLLVKIRDSMRLNIEVEPYDDVVLDRSLDSSRFRYEFDFMPPSWNEMIQALALDETPYDQWKGR